MPGTPDGAAAPAPPDDLARTRELEGAALRGWPATIQLTTADGWVLRATPGLDRARSNHALTPCRALRAGELAPAIETVRAFARQHRIRTGIQVTPTGLHDELEGTLAAQGWQRRWPARVLTRAVLRGAADPPGTRPGDHQPPRSGPEPPRSGSQPLPSGPQPQRARDAGEGFRHAGQADGRWLKAWARCEPERDVEAHARTVLGALAGRAYFGRIGEAAVGIAVPWRGTLGLYCVAVDPAWRRHGLGRALTQGLIALQPGAAVFLQVEANNGAAAALYAGLGFREQHRYAHWVSPDP